MEISGLGAGVENRSRFESLTKDTREIRLMMGSIDSIMPYFVMKIESFGQGVSGLREGGL